MKREFLKFVVFTLLVCLAPLVANDGYLLNVLVFVGIHAILAIALNLLLGFAGQISLGHAGFFGLGAYLSGVLTATYAWNPWAAMALAAAAVGLLSFILGFPILKLKGHYLAMATLGLGIILYILFNEAVEITGGPSGLSGIPNLALGGFSFSSDLRNYYLVWGCALTAVLLSVNLVNSRTGRALQAVHYSETAARVMGVNARLLKVQVFTLSAILSSLAGSLYAHTMTFVAPASFGFNFSVELVTMVIIGGLGTIYGPILGAALLTLLPEFLRAFRDYDIVMYGSLLIIMTIFMPEGLVRGVPALCSKLLRKLRSRGGAHAEA